MLKYDNELSIFLNLNINKGSFYTCKKKRPRTSKNYFENLLYLYIQLCSTYMKLFKNSFYLKQ